jgi:hypothetical protein
MISSGETRYEQQKDNNQTYSVSDLPAGSRRFSIQYIYSHEK